MLKGVDDDEEQPTLDLIFTHIYDTVQINTTVPWDELDPKTQVLAKKVVDYYRMQASVKVDAEVRIRKLNITEHDPDEGLIFSLIATVDKLGDDEIDIDSLFDMGEDDG